MVVVAGGPAGSPVAEPLGEPRAVGAAQRLQFADRLGKVGRPASRRRRGGELGIGRHVAGHAEGPSRAADWAAKRSRAHLRSRGPWVAVNSVSTGSIESRACAQVREHCLRTPARRLRCSATSSRRGRRSSVARTGSVNRSSARLRSRSAAPASATSDVFKQASVGATAPTAPGACVAALECLGHRQRSSGVLVELAGAIAPTFGAFAVCIASSRGRDHELCQCGHDDDPARRAAR